MWRLLDFKIEDISVDCIDTESETEENTEQIEQKQSVIIIICINEIGQPCCFRAINFKPYFYIEIGNLNINNVRDSIVKRTKINVDSVEIVKVQRKKLQGFDDGQIYNFAQIKCESMFIYNKITNLWYDYPDNKNSFKKLKANGVLISNKQTTIFESDIPPLLKFFHDRNINPSGWIRVENIKVINNYNKYTNCIEEYEVDYNNIHPIDCITKPNFKICSFDCEMSSSHGDFPIAIKNYFKLASQLIETCIKTELTHEDIIDRIINAFQQTNKYIDTSTVYPKDKDYILNNCIESWINDNTFTITKEIIDSSIPENIDENDDNEGQQQMTDWITTSVEIKTSSAIQCLINLSCLKNKTQIKLNDIVYSITKSLDKHFPKLEGDKVTYIGSTFIKYASPEYKYSNCLVLGECDTIDNVSVQCCNNETDLLMAWNNLILQEDPDIIIGYNIDGFDFKFMADRAKELNCFTEFLNMSRIKNEICYDEKTETLKQTKIKVASGEYISYSINMTGRINVDLLKYFRRNENFASYKLDDVSGNFINADIITHLTDNSFQSKNTNGLKIGSYVHLLDDFDQQMFDGDKFMITDINTDVITINSNISFVGVTKWALAKDDVTPKEIFELWSQGNNADRAKVGKYCIQDCDLVLLLFNLCDILTGFTEMSNICYTPIKFIIERGQGIKIKSFVGKICKDNNILIQTINKGNETDAYEGAAVLEPKTGIYFDNPIACLDFASLYPSTQMSYNISHDTLVWKKEFDLQGKCIIDTSTLTKYDNIPGYTYCNIEYDTVKYNIKENGKFEKIKVGTTLCRFVQPNENETERVGIFPMILKSLLYKRKETRKLAAKETNPFMQNILNKRQLGYKVTANSLYGQSGSKTSMFYNKDISACTTSMGKKLLFYAKQIIEECYKQGTIVSVLHTENETHIPDKIIVNSECIYGDTDSVFFTLNMTDLNGNNIRGKLALDITIRVAKEIGKIISNYLPKPQDLEYEKTFMPFCLMSKKRYCGRLYEDDPNIYVNKDMGNVNKRRDNARIVKDVFIAVRDSILNIDTNKSSVELVDYSLTILKQMLDDIISQKVDIKKLEISKSLRSWYVNPYSISQKVLANRVMERQKGIIFKAGDRITYVHIIPKHIKKDMLQGDKIETTEYTVKNNLKIDYSYYIENQIMNPIVQIYSLVLELLPNIRNNKSILKEVINNTEIIKNKYINDPDKRVTEINKYRARLAQKYIFDPYIIKLNSIKTGNQLISSFFKKN